jgi:hypothetical protein
MPDELVAQFDEEMFASTKGTFMKLTVLSISANAP